jgi:hypothetical protein
MTTLLVIDNDYCQLLTTNHKIKQTLWDCLRFRERNYFHSRLYKQRLWDGYTEFFKKETGRFLTGLIPEVSAALKHFDIEYEIQDNRSEFKFSGFNVVCPGSIVQTAMDRLGYEVVMSDNLAITDNFSKSNSWVALWKIKETQ